ncbi:MAG: tetratricopeptide repeat protein [Elusimicrobia bacterium]|nr:tetratricopeptide repeat protein [Elusimicrobiota bacterium]
MATRTLVQAPPPPPAPSGPPALLAAARRALALYDVEGWQEAVAVLREALELAPHDGACRAALAEAYAYWGFRREVSGLDCVDDYAMSLAEATEALKLAPERADCHRAMALALRRGEWANPERRREEVLAALDLDSGDPETWHEYWRVRGYDPEDPTLKRALQLGSGNCGLRIDLGVVLCERGRLREAEVQLRAALESNPRNALAHYDLAMVLWRGERTPEALALLRRARELHPEDPLLEDGLELMEGR